MLIIGYIERITGKPGISQVRVDQLTGSIGRRMEANEIGTSRSKYMNFVLAYLALVVPTSWGYSSQLSYAIGTI